MSHHGFAVGVLLVALGFAAGPGWAGVAPPPPQLAVFADPDGTNNGQVELTEAPGQMLDLHVELGAFSSSSNVCRAGGGDGHEICGYRIEIEVVGDGYIESFLPASPGPPEHVLRSWPTDFSSLDVRRLTVAFAGAEPAPTSPDPIYIGTLGVDATDGARVLVTGHEVVGADLTPLSVPGDTIAATPLPEPGSLAQGAAALLALALLERWRRRRRLS